MTYKIANVPHLLHGVVIFFKSAPIFNQNLKLVFKVIYIASCFFVIGLEFKKSPHREVGGARFLSCKSLLYCTICAYWN